MLSSGFWNMDCYIFYLTETQVPHLQNGIVIGTSILVWLQKLNDIYETISIIFDDT